MRVVAETQEIRAAFPALSRREGEHSVAYFDGPGGTQVPSVVIDAMTDHLLSHNANSGWVFPTSVEALGVAERARNAAADFLGGRPEEIVFGPNMTSLTMHVARAFGPTLEPGDEIVVTRLDHRANVDPWRAIAEDRGVSIRVVPFEPANGRLDWSRFEESVGPRTRLVTMAAAANSVGTVNDVRRAAQLARSCGAPLFVDAVHGAAHQRTDVAEWECDAVVCSPYKFYGPHAGILWARADLLASLEPMKVGPAPDADPMRWEPGTPSYEALAGTTAAIDWLASLAGEAGSRRERLDDTFRALHERGVRLGRRLWDGLSDLPGVRTFGPTPDEPRTPTVAFLVEGRSAEEVAAHLAEQAGVYVSHGHFYAPDVLKDLGVPPSGLVRAGCACYTGEDEVERLVAGVKAIVTA